MDVVVCRCLFCQAHLLSCVNEWIQVTQTRYCAADSHTIQLAKDGLLLCPPARLGSSQLENCSLQPLRCKKCTLLIGAKCVEAPEEKAQYRDRSFLKLSTMVLRLVSTGEVVKPSVKARLAIMTSDITNPGPISLASDPQSIAAGPSVQHPAREGDLKKSRYSLTISDNKGHTPPKPLSEDGDLEMGEEKSTDRVDPPKDLPHGLWEIMNEQRQDIDRILRSVEMLESQISAISSTVSKMQNVPEAIPPNADMPVESPDVKIDTPREDLELLTEQGSKFAEKCNEIDGLRLELETMKDTVKSLKEASAAKPVQLTSPLTDRRSKVNHPGRKTNTLSIRSSPQADVAHSAKSARTPRPPPTDSNRIALQPRGLSTSSEETSSEDELQSSASNSNESVDGQEHGEEKRILGDDDMRDEDRQEVALEELGPGEILDAGRSSFETDKERLELNDQDHTVTAVNSNENDCHSTIVLNGLDDSEDIDYSPRRHTPTSPRSRGGTRGRGRGRGGRVRKSLNPRIPTPEWEKPDWNGPEDLKAPNGSVIHMTPISSRGRTIMRRGLSGGIATTGSTSKRPRSASPKLEPALGRLRDAEGFLLRWDGQRDKRSTRGRDSSRKSRESRVVGSMAQPSEHEKIMAQIFPERRKSAAILEDCIKVEDDEGLDDQWT